MKDHHTVLMEQLVILLEPVGLPVKSFIPNNHKTPYIYIGDIQTGNQVANKQSFEVQGLMTVQLWSGTNEWKGSYRQPLLWLNQIKELLQPTTKSIIDMAPDFKMVYLKFDNDTGIESFGNTNRNWVVTVNYDIEFMQIV